MDFGAALRQEVNAWRQSHLQDMQEWAAKSAQITHLVVEHIKQGCMHASRQGLTQTGFLIYRLVEQVDPSTNILGAPWQNPSFIFGSAPGWIKGAFLSKGACLADLHASSTFDLNISDVIDQVLPRVEAALKQQGLEVTSWLNIYLTVPWVALAWAAPQVPPLSYPAPPVNGAGQATPAFKWRSRALGAPAPLAP
mmetsp:Transcript_41968/g.135777  ORF Transcript_41968/g.135777 Transcript_41968/m.135777 type:complete len:195 (-) Transcript_41968:229-813(-)